MPTSDDDTRYRRWIEEEWWDLHGCSNDAIAIALGLEPIWVSLPGEIPQYGFKVDAAAAQRFLEVVDAARKAAERQATNAAGDSVGVDSELPDLFADIPVKVPAGGEWDVPEEVLLGMTFVRAPEFVERAIRMGYPVPEVVRKGVRENAKRWRSTVRAEKDCEGWLVEEMRSEKPGVPKRDFLKLAQDRFGISERGFDRAWANAVKETGATDFSKPGRREKP